MPDSLANELASANIITPAETLLRENNDFKRFVERMIATEQTYFIKQRPGVERCVISLQGEELNSVSPETRSQWLNMCLREYLERKREFEKRYQTRQKLLVKMLLILCILLTLLWLVWPLWDMIIGVEESYYITLGVSTKASEDDVKRAYREQIKKWHPDHNPQCGEECRLHIIKLRNAYDTLLERGSKQFELINKYRENLSVLRSLVSFRLYSIAGESALGIIELIRVASKALHITNYNTLVVSIICKVSVMFFFMACEIKINGHFNVMMLINIFFFGVAMCKTSAITMLIEQRKRTAYINLLMECGIFILPIVTGNALYLLIHREELDVATDFLRMIWGALYVLSFLYRFSPNLYDNLMMRKCSIALPYLNANQNYLSWFTLVSVEFGWLLDDIFAFTCRVPSAYRIIVWVVHATYLIQLFSLPKDRPVVKLKTHSTKVYSNGDSILSQETDNNSRETETLIISKTLKRSNLANNVNQKVSEEECEREHEWKESNSADSVEWASMSRELLLNVQAKNFGSSANNSGKEKLPVNNDSDNSKECHARENDNDDDDDDDDVICKNYDNDTQEAKPELCDDSSITTLIASSNTQQLYPLSEKEAKLLTSVDIEHLQWVDISVNKYIPYLEQCKETFASQYGGKNSMVDFACSDDLQYIVIVGVLSCSEKSQGSNFDSKRNINTDDSSNIHKKNTSHSRSREKTNRQKLLAREENAMEKYSAVVLFRDFNPHACKIFAMQNGPRVFYNYWFTSPEYRQNAIKNYVSYFGSNNRYLLSEVWRGVKSLPLLMLNDVKGSNQSSFLSRSTLQCTSFANKQIYELQEMLMYVMCAILAILFSTVLFINYSPLQILKALSSLPITLNPFVSNEFGMYDTQHNKLPNIENTSKVAASLFVFGTDFLMCTADF